jgi:hypothetical protein
MKIYRMNPKNGFLETQNTDGNYCPSGWYKSEESAKRNKNRKVKESVNPRGQSENILLMDESTETLTTKDELNTLYENTIVNENNDEISFEEFKKDGWNGVDRSLDISLFEYGLIYNEKEKEFRVIYGVKTDEDGNYTEFDFSWIDKKQIEALFDGEEWIGDDDLQSFAETNGYDSIEDYKNEVTGEERRLIDLHNYFNYLDLFGDVVESHSTEYVYNWLSKRNHKDNIVVRY